MQQEDQTDLFDTGVGDGGDFLTALAVLDGEELRIGEGQTREVSRK
jgi:hypothetical protein